MSYGTTGTIEDTYRTAIHLMSTVGNIFLKEETIYMQNLMT